MSTSTPYDRLPAYVRAFLFDWRNWNNEEFLQRFQRRTLKELTIYELDKLFREAVVTAQGEVGSIMQRIETEDSNRNLKQDA